MTAQQSDDGDYQAAMQRNAAALYPSNVTEFRQLWGTGDVYVWYREIVEHLADPELKTLAESLRLTFVQKPGRLMEIWELARHTAGLA